MTRVSLSGLAFYKMSQDDVLHYLEASGFDLRRPYTTHVVDDGAMIDYEQEEEDGQ